MQRHGVWSRVLVACTVVGVTGLARRAESVKPKPCPNGSYVISGEALVTGASAAALNDAVTVQGKKIGIASGCPLARGQVKANRTGTHLSVKWHKCGDLKRVRLTATIAPGCAAMSGTFASHGHTAMPFHALSSTTTTTVVGATTTSTTLPSVPQCTSQDRQQMEQVVASGGTFVFACSGTIELEQTLIVAAGANVTLDSGGKLVLIERDFNAQTPYRLFDVQGGTLSLKGLTLQNGLDAGSNGGNGTNGTPGDYGDPGTLGLYGSNGVPGQDGTPGTAGTEGQSGAPGGDGGDGEGGALRVAAGSTVSISHCSFFNNLVYGGRGGDGQGDGSAPGGRGGDGGGGGDGQASTTQGGPSGHAGNGAPGMDGGDAGDANGGGGGGSGKGGAIYNEGMLTISDSTFQNNYAEGGAGGRGGDASFGGDGGYGGPGGWAYDTFHTLGGAAGDGADAGEGGDGSDGGAGGAFGDGGSGEGGAIFSQTAATITNLSTSTSNPNQVAGGSGGPPECVGHPTCPGTSGPGGQGGQGGAGASEYGVVTPAGADGNDGTDGDDAHTGAEGLAAGRDVYTP